jgi:hypothetical protein
MQRRAIPVVVSIAALAAQSLGLASTALAAGPVDVPFTYTGAEQHFDVPAGVTAIHLALVGGQGGSIDTTAAGKGARVEGDLPATPGARLYVEVGGNGANGNSSTATSGGFNGGGAGGYNRQVGFWGGGGGGASDVRTVTRSDPGSLSSRLVIAAAGGAAGMGGGTGGEAGGAGTGGAAGGGAGTSAAGGAGGSGTPNGSPGSLGLGGAGSDGSISGAGGGGGGGAGYYGGGGGAYGGGGGGGSSYSGSATNPAVTPDSTGTPSITITYTPGPPPTPGPSPTPTSGPDNGTVNAQFSVPTSAACLELSTTSVDFGSVRLGSENVAASPDVTVTNCSGSSESILARGSDASASGTTWTLVGGSVTCADTLGLDNYRMALESSSATVGLSTSNATLGSLAGGDTSTQTARMWAACPGSTGSGQLMTTQITFLATEGG